jgi:uncharacterized protein
MKQFILLLALLLISCNSHQGMEQVVLSSGDTSLTLWVEIADDPEEHSLGLMNRNDLPEDQGMLFVFEEPRPLSFWMKNTRIPLDILFFDENQKLINALSMDPCLPSEALAKEGTKDPCPLYSSELPAQYALEVNAGFIQQNGVDESWSFQIEE